jgi:hypothetical protein
MFGGQVTVLFIARKIYFGGRLLINFRRDLWRLRRELRSDWSLSAPLQGRTNSQALLARKR